MKENARAAGVFLDTSILIGGVIAPPHGNAEARRILLAPDRWVTAWHCCLEFYSVLTRLPPGQRVTPSDVLRLMKEYIIGRMEILQLPAASLGPFAVKAAELGMRGGRLYDAHIAEIALVHRVRAVVTENPVDFVLLLQSGIPVLRASEFLASRISRQGRPEEGARD